VDAPTTPSDDEADRLQQLTQVRFAGRVRELLSEGPGGGLVLQGKAGSYYLKQMVQETAVGATALRLAANEIARVD